jgi:serine/threonine protein kinase
MKRSLSTAAASRTRKIAFRNDFFNRITRLMKTSDEQPCLETSACILPKSDTLRILTRQEPIAIFPGRHLGPYEIFSAIGAGGMGDVYKARDTRLDRIIAIKVLPAHLADRIELRERFGREAKTIAGLNHPHISSQRFEPPR